MHGSPFVRDRARRATVARPYSLRREAPRRCGRISGKALGGRRTARVAEGSSTEAPSLSPHTVRTHLRKLEASSRAHAVAIAIREAAIRV